MAAPSIESQKYTFQLPESDLRKFHTGWSHVDLDLAIEAAYDDKKSPTAFYDELFWQVMNSRPRLAEEFKTCGFSVDKIRSPQDQQAVRTLMSMCEMFQVDLFSKRTGLTTLPPKMSVVIRKMEKAFPNINFKKILDEIRKEGFKSSTEFYDKLFWKLLGHREPLSKAFSAVKGDITKISSSDDKKILEALFEFCRAIQIQTLAAEFGTDFDGISEEFRRCVERMERTFPDANTSALIKKARKSPTSLQVYDELFWGILNSRPELSKKFVGAKFDPAKLPDALYRYRIDSVVTYSAFSQVKLFSQMIGVHPSHIPASFQPILRSIEEYLKKTGKVIPYAKIKAARAATSDMAAFGAQIFNEVNALLPPPHEFANLPEPFRKSVTDFKTFCCQTLPHSIRARDATLSSETAQPIPQAAPRVLKTPLRLVEKARGSTSLNVTSQMLPPVLAGDYSVFVPRQSGGIIVVADKLARTVDIPRQVGVMQITVDWKEIQKQYGTDYISRVPMSAGHSHTLTSQLPHELRLLAEAATNAHFTIWSNLAVTTVTVSPKKVCSAEDGKYVLCVGSAQAPGNHSIVFVTKNSHGKSLEPRNWQRIQSTDATGQLPKHVAKILRDMMHEAENPGIIHLGNVWASVAADKIGFGENTNNWFTDNISDVGNNICADPVRTKHIYYCKKDTNELILIDTTNPDAKTWHPQSIRFPRAFEDISGLQFDPSGRFLVFNCKKGLVILEKESMQEMKVLPSMTNAHFDQNGRMRVIDSEGKLVIFDTNFFDLVREIDDYRALILRDKLKPGAFVDEAAQERARQAELKKKYARYVPLKDEFEPKFIERLGAAKTLADVQRVGTQLTDFENSLRAGGIEQEGVAYITEAMRLGLAAKQKKMASGEVSDVLISVRAQLGQKGITIATALSMKGEMASVDTIKAFVDDTQRKEIRSVRRLLDEKIAQLFMAESTVIAAKVDGIIAKAKKDLAGFKSKADFDDWHEFTYPDIVKELRDMREECPEEAKEAHVKLVESRTILDDLAKKYDEKFRREYTGIREKAAQQLRETIHTIERSIKSFFERMRDKKFTSRDDAEQYIQVSKIRQSIETEIKSLESLDLDVSKKIARDFETGISRFLSDVERGTLSKVSASGQQVIKLGDQEFPIWEETAAEVLKRRADFVFLPDRDANVHVAKTADWRGDIGVQITSSRGTVSTRRLYEGLTDEQEYRLGLNNYAGKHVPPSYLTASDFTSIRALSVDWSLGSKSKLRQEYRSKKNAILALKTQRPDKFDQAVYDTWKKSYQAARDDFGKFCTDNYIYIFLRKDTIRREPDEEYEDGMGSLVEWESYWTLDPQTEKYLEHMLFDLRQQLKLKSGLFMLRGHAGTGKDVLVDMFCSLTKRRKFVFDCSKWTTEADLGEELTLQSEPGSMLPSTVRLPSAVVKGLQTPGAVIYFNEWNAMPEQAQLFLHALLDGKRSLTLKTRSGTIIKAQPSVLIVASRNPSTYKGVFEVQPATTSRQVEMDVHYPSLYRPADKNDRNRNQALDVSEALRIARSMDAFSRMAEESNMSKNQFVQMWELYVNGIDNGSPEPTEEQKFDIDVILGLTQFAAQLRQHFMDRTGKDPDKKMQALPINYPITARELRLCGNFVSEMPLSKKLQTTPEALARETIERYFLSHIEHLDDRRAVQTAMQNWTFAKRPAR